MSSPPLTVTAPRAATARDPSRVTDGDAGAFVAWAMRRPWLPWQRHAGDLIGEQLPSGRYAHQVAVILVPRQCGKTTFVFDVVTGRGLRRAGYECAYTAQTGQLASERMKDRMLALATSPLAGAFDTYRSTGKERITAVRTRSYVKAFPPIPGALRGSACDAVVVDEAQELTEAQGRELDQQIMPTFATKPARQLILIGTAGTDDSAYLARYLDLARSGAPGIALVDYGFPPDVDPRDETVWASSHPGLAGGLTDVDALRAALLVMGDDGFAREYGNVWSSSATRVIPDAVWRAAAAPLARPADTRVVFGADIAVDRRAAAVVAAWTDTGGRPVLEVVEYRTGTLWLADRLAQLRARHPGTALWLPADGPAGSALDALERAGTPYQTLRQRDYAAACAALYDAVSGQRVWHHADAALDLAAAHATQRPLGDAWVWGRRTASADVSPLTAATLAWHAFTRPAPPAPLRPALYAG